VSRGDVVIDLFFVMNVGGDRGAALRILLNVVQLALETLRQAVAGTGLRRAADGWCVGAACVSPDCCEMM